MKHIKSLTLLWLMFLAGSFTLSAKDKPEYSIINIPGELLKEADAVIRQNQLSIFIQPDFRVKEISKEVITIFNAQKDDASEKVIHYDKYISIKNISCNIYDASGNFVKSVKNKDINDYSAVSGVSLYEDNRVKHLKAEYGRYPYTVEIQYERLHKGYLELPRWIVQNDTRIAVQNSSLIVENTGDQELKYITTNLKTTPKTEDISDGKRYTWKVENIPAIERLEPYYPAIEQVPGVGLQTDKFNYLGFEGSKASWPELIQWEHDLQIGRQELPENLKAKIKELTDGLSPLEKAKTVYEWMQKNTRYVSVQLGIGGFQAMLAQDVYSKGYGDCKALTNYTKALLDVVGVKSVYASVYGGDSPPIIRKGEISQRYTNHVILCIPNEKDTVWLECTSQTNPFGYLGDFTGNRTAMFCEDGKGRIVNTTSYSEKDNRRVRTTTVKLSEDGNAEIEITSKSQGILYEFPDAISRKSEDERRKILYKALEVPNPNIESYKVKIFPNRLPSSLENIKINARRVATKTGNRIFLRPNIVNRYPKITSSKHQRKYDFILRNPKQEIDSVIWTIPEGMEIETQPKDVKIDTPYGKYETAIKLEGNKLTYTRIYLRKAGKFPPEEYQKFIEFRQTMYKNDKKRVVMKKRST
ncbi:hypothetical protein FUAX_22130 [Fulvitalea axinellae]|uniref:DUF3857 domain-containing protein n=1 Tax=Fulvitalea axinellae TaxID=1182444 RepID=A0AAU9CLA9_9BACT|nr:hypothetical protein FUAX_22130 [Fulvitalea axinellae]